MVYLGGAKGDAAAALMYLVSLCHDHREPTARGMLPTRLSKHKSGIVEHLCCLFILYISTIVQAFFGGQRMAPIDVFGLERLYDMSSLQSFPSSTRVVAETPTDTHAAKKRTYTKTAGARGDYSAVAGVNQAPGTQEP